MEQSQNIPEEFVKAAQLIDSGNFSDGMKLLSKTAQESKNPDVSARCYYFIGVAFEMLSRTTDAYNSFGLVERHYPQLNWARMASAKRMRIYYGQPDLPMPAFPPVVQIEPTNACNLKCIMCPRPKMKKTVGMMPQSLFQKIIDECRERQAMIVKLYFMGEPLLHPKIYELLKYAVTNGDIDPNCPPPSIWIQTNGVWTDQAIPAKLIKTGLNGIGFSFSGINQADYEKARVGGDFSELCRNIEETVNQRNRMKSNTRVNITLNVFHEAEKDISEFKNRWEKIVDHVDVIYTVPHPERLDLDDKGQTIKNPESSIPEAPVICRDGLTSLVVRWDGEIGFCCGDYDTEVKLGNASQTTLAEAWNSPAHLQIHKDICEGRIDNISVCRGCPVRLEIDPKRLDVLKKINRGE